MDIFFSWYIKNFNFRKSFTFSIYNSILVTLIGKYFAMKRSIKLLNMIFNNESMANLPLLQTKYVPWEVRACNIIQDEVPTVFMIYALKDARTHYREPSQTRIFLWSMHKALKSCIVTFSYHFAGKYYHYIKYYIAFAHILCLT